MANVPEYEIPEVRYSFYLFSSDIVALKNYKFLEVVNSFATTVHGLSVLQMFHLSNGDLLFFVACLQHLQSP